MLNATLGARGEAMRARRPDEQGHVERDGVRVAWERFGDAPRAVLLMPTWEIVHSRIWKGQVPFLARSFTVLTFDPRGNGRSDRPLQGSAYDRRELTRDALAVLDAAGVCSAVVVSWCGSGEELALAAEHPDRVRALVLIAPDLLLTPDPDETRYEHIGDWPAFAGAFFDDVFCEPHSTKQREDAVAWAMQTDAATIERGLAAAWNNGAEEARQMLGAVGCPALVVQGSRDAIAGRSRGRAVAAELPGARLVELDGCGHGPQLRDPVRFNLELRDFLAPEAAPARRWQRAQTRRRRALYVSSPIGLGHARRDLAIAHELRRLQPDLEIEWLAQHPVTALLAERGERIHPLSAELASESAHIEAESNGHELHCFQALRRMDEILLANFMVFLDAVQDEPFDLWIGDEAWEIDYYLHENPELKTAAYVWLTDFVGYLPMPAGGEREAALTSDYNAEMVEQVERFPRVRDRAVFIGEPDDIVPLGFGEGLPAIREWSERHFEFAGYVLDSELEQLGDRERLRKELGYAPEEQVCVVTVGGSGVGSELMQRVAACFPEAKRLVPGLRMIVVAGPRIDPEALEVPPGVELRGFVADLHRHLAACDLAIVQGGLATGMELIATRRPFLYFPLRGHFEQCLHVHHRLARHGANGRMDLEQAADPETLAEAIAAQIGREVDYRPVPVDGAARAAAIIAELL